MEKLVCECGTEFESYPSAIKRGAKYCAFECYRIYSLLGRKPWCTGKKMPRHVREKMSLAHEKAWAEGKMQHRKKLLGNLNHSKNPETKQKIRAAHEKNGLWTPKKYLSEWQLYKREVKSFTRSNRKNLSESWNGLCFYCHKDISKQLKWSKHDQTIDHKYSVFFGFHHKINPAIIGASNNLCICCRSCNSKKREKISWKN